MASKRYPYQLVIMCARPMEKAVRKLAADYDVSLAEAGRIVIALGLPQFEAEMKRRGHVKAEGPARPKSEAPAKAVKAGRPVKRAARAVPVAQFSAPAA